MSSKAALESQGGKGCHSEHILEQGLLTNTIVHLKVICQYNPFKNCNENIFDQLASICSMFYTWLLGLPLKTSL